MSRKSYTRAVKDWHQLDYDRWRLLARNPDFRKDLAAYLNGCGKGLFPGKRPLAPRLRKRYARLRQQHLEKWRIHSLPDAVLWPDSDFTITPDRLDRWYQGQRAEDPEFTAYSYPVFMSRARVEYPQRMLIEFSVNISMPIDHILAFLDKELRGWYWKTFGSHRRGKPTSVDLHLQVYDLVCGAETTRRHTFVEAARKLKKPVSTVRGAYFAARAKIGITEEFQPQSRRRFSRGVTSRLLEDPGPVSGCQDLKCRNAKTPEDFCKPHREYCERDYVPQKDQLVDDLSAIDHGGTHRSESVDSDD